MKKLQTHSFTLVEMLMVIAIIGVLMGLILPGINKARTQAKKTRARTEMNSLKIAVNQYETNYGILPTFGSTEAALTTAQYDQLIAWLSQTDKSGNTYKDTGNLRGLKLLEVNKAGVYQDPWDNDYHVIIDADYDGQIAAANVVGLSEAVPTSVVVWSEGPDGASGTTATNRDNLYSVETDWDDTAGKHVLK